MARTVGKVTTGLALALSGGGLVTAGVVLLLRATWLLIAAPLGAIWASVIVGAALVLIGALVVTLSLLHLRRHATPSDTDLIARITAAFVQGLAAGRAARDR